MKRVKTSKRGSSMKDGGTPQTIDEYLAKVPEPAHSTLEKIRSMIRAASPAEATEAISYGIPAFKYKGLLVAFAAFSNHCSFFPGSSTVLPQFKNQLKGYRTSKGTIRFPMGKPLPAALVRKLVKLRVAKNDLKQKK